METCEICRGSGVIHLYRHQPLSAAASIGASAPSETIQNHVATYPCPECAASVSFDRVQISKATAMQVIDRRMASDEGLIEAIRRDAAHALIGELVSNGLIAFAMRRPPGDPHEFTQQVALTATVAVIAPKVVATLEERIAERQADVAQEVVEEAISQIGNWGSDYCWTSISKDEAYRSIRSALDLILLRRQHKQESAGDGR